MESNLWFQDEQNAKYLRCCHHSPIKQTIWRYPTAQNHRAFVHHNQWPIMIMISLGREPHCKNCDNHSVSFHDGWHLWLTWTRGNAPESTSAWSKATKNQSVSINQYVHVFTVALTQRHKESLWFTAISQAEISLDRCGVTLVQCVDGDKLIAEGHNLFTCI